MSTFHDPTIDRLVVDIQDRVADLHDLHTKQSVIPSTSNLPSNMHRELAEVLGVDPECSWAFLVNKVKKLVNRSNEF